MLILQHLKKVEAGQEKQQQMHRQADLARSRRCDPPLSPRSRSLPRALSPFALSHRGAGGRGWEAGGRGRQTLCGFNVTNIIWFK